MVDLSRKEEKVLTLLRPSGTIGQFEPLAEIPYMSRRDVIKVLQRIIAYLEAVKDMKALPNVKLLVDANAQPASEPPPLKLITTGKKSPQPAPKGNKASKSSKGKRKPRTPVW